MVICGWNVAEPSTTYFKVYVLPGTKEESSRDSKNAVPHTFTCVSTKSVNVNVATAGAPAITAVATREPLGSRKSKPCGSPVSSGGRAIEKVSLAVALSGMHHWISVRSPSDRRGLLGVTVMLRTGLGIVAAPTGSAAAIATTPPSRRQDANNFEPVRPNRFRLINDTLLSIARISEYCVARYPRPGRPTPVHPEWDLISTVGGRCVMPSSQRAVAPQAKRSPSSDG